MSEDIVTELEKEHATVYRELVATVDQLLQETVKAQLIENGDIDEQYRQVLDKFHDIDLGVLHSTIKGESTQEQRIVAFLKEMIHLRLQILEQHLSTYPTLRAIHSDGAKDDLYGKRLLDRVNEKDQVNLDTVKLLTENSELRTLGGISITKNLPLLAQDRQKMRYCQELQKEIDELKRQGHREEQVYDEFAELQKSHDICSRHVQVLSQLNTNLVSSLSKANIAQDETLRDIVMDCGEYRD